ncbi:hypothetical protein ACA910_000295 [Epithemia clementina (nom. ined.)]
MASDAFATDLPRGVQGTVLKEVIDSTSPGPSCLPPMQSKEDPQWHKLDWEKRHVPMKLPSVFSSTKFVRRALTPRELGGVLDLPREIIKSEDLHTLATWLKGVQVPFKIRCKVLRRLYRWSNTGYGFMEDPDEVTEAVRKEHPSQPNLDNETALGGDVGMHDVEIQGPTVKATKSNDAEVPEHLWDTRVASGMERIMEPYEFSRFVKGLRVRLHRYWVRKSHPTILGVVVSRHCSREKGGDFSLN